MCIRDRYNADNSWEEMSQAVEELAADGLTIDADNPIQMDVVYASSSEVFTNRANSLKQSIDCLLYTSYRKKLRRVLDSVYVFF